MTRIGSEGIGGLSGLTLCDRYRLEQLVGAGGMAQVWRATDEVLGREVAVKLLHPHLAGDSAFVQRFRQEAVAAARLSHPGIVGVYDTCSDGHHEAIVMELLDGMTLRRHLDEQGALDADTTVRIGLRLLDALEAAHRSGLVHRDVKPSNILLCRDGRVKIADFGIAKADDVTELTSQGTLVGTATYLAPEQLLGEPVDGRTDLYSLGIVLYECLTGRVPFQGDSGPAVALARLHSDPVDPRRLRADVPPRVADAIMRVLQRRPEDRFDSAADLRAALLQTGVSPRPAMRMEPEVLDEPTTETESFTHSERGWLLPALFIALVGSALTVAGLLLRNTALDDGPDEGTTTETTATAAAGPLTVAEALTYDPQGDGVESDGRGEDAIDGDPSSTWRTETYEPPGFPAIKAGVGFGVRLDGRARVDRMRIEGPGNGWDASVFVVDAEALDGVDPTSLTPAGRIEGASATVDVDLTGTDAAARTGRIVLVWIDDLGEPVEDGRFRVELAEVSLEGAQVGGG